MPRQRRKDPHAIIFTTRADLPDSHRDEVFGPEPLDGARACMALGMTRMAAAELGFDATPLEGFDPASVDTAFKIRETGYTTTVLLALGYPDAAKVYTNPIPRFDHDRLFTFV